MISFQTFTIFILLAVVAPIIGAITILFIILFERKLAIVEQRHVQEILEQELHHTQYLQLNQQIQPHFLFNSLNAILSLARLQRISELINALEHFSAFLKGKHQQQATLLTIEDELSYTQHYLAIQQLRFGSRLHVEMECSDEAVCGLIPPFLIQTLVENSFKHGLEQTRGHVQLHIRMKREDEQMILQVSNTSPKVAVSTPPSPSGYGLENIQRRLQLLFPENTTVKLVRGEGEVSVIVCWPFIREGEKNPWLEVNPS
ncbi:sensor histidine kinase [Rubeoparvulum massiliense]|uniref:sensor histidine kinase n=1 Tax=Rubeoparvulum massiliense TaxID=1631346 RepID=UPI00065E8D44|nr:histidine kinase [Rubeoparvulum massiliense]